MKSTLQIVWFKRDLRLEDHEPIARAAKRGPVLPLYIADPAVLFAPDFDSSHWTFIRAGLIELRRKLQAIGQPLIVRSGDSSEVMAAIHAESPIGRIWAHQESGNAVARARDQQVRDWAGARKIRFTELPVDGVVRNNNTDAGHDRGWKKHLRAPPAVAPRRLMPATGFQPGPIPDHDDLGLPRDSRIDVQQGGETLAHQVLSTFLQTRGETYSREHPGSPLQTDASSRLSPYLTWGNLSTRQVARETRARIDHVRGLPARDRGDWLGSLATLESRLRLRSSSVQEFEDAPLVESERLVRALDVLDRYELDEQRFAAWSIGMTGYPLIDACMRALLATGWLSFRMRSMLVSFAAFDLWLPWRALGLLLARRSLDYEPGIHWKQVQLQAGTAGPGAFRVYNPTKQAQEHDPHGDFIREWVPELADVPATFIHTPWFMPEGMQASSGCVIGRDYPVPIVDHLTATREAHRRIDEAMRGLASDKSGDDPRPPVERFSKRAVKGKKQEPDQHAQLSFPLE